MSQTYKNVSIIIISFIPLYILIALFLFFLYPQKSPDSSLIIINALMFLMYIIGLFCVRVKLKQLPIIIFLFHFFSGTLLMLFYNSLGMPFGFDAVDAYFYREQAELKNQSTLNLILNSDIDISDRGYIIIRHLTSLIASSLSIQNLILVIINAFFISISCKKLIRLSLFFFDRKKSKLISILFCLCAFAIYSTPSGMKENIFIFLIISSFLHFEEFRFNKSIPSLANFFLFFVLTIFFRWYISLIVLMSTIPFLVFRKLKNVKPIIILSVLLTIVLAFPRELVEFLNINNDLINVAIAVQEYRSVDQIGVLVNYISTWLGPFPTILLNSQEAPLIYSSGNYYKMIFSFFFISSIFLIIKENKNEFMPYLVYVFLNMGLIVISNTSLDMRFQYTMLPIFILISFLSVKSFSTLKKVYFTTYTFLVITLIVLYNTR